MIQICWVLYQAAGGGNAETDIPVRRMSQGEGRGASHAGCGAKDHGGDGKAEHALEPNLKRTEVFSHEIVNRDGVFMIGQLLVPPHAVSAESETAAEAMQWRAYSEFSDGRRFISDGALLFDSRYLPSVPLPKVSIHPPNIQRFLDSVNDHGFDLSDLDREPPDGHYIGPGPIKLNGKYIELLKTSPLEPSWRFMAKASTDPVLILDGDKVVGVVMPMKM